MPAMIMAAPVALEPSGDVLPDFQFVGRAAQADPAPPIKAVVVEVRHSDPRRAGRWTSGWLMVVPDPASGRFKIANPGQPALPPRQALRWRMRARAKAKVVSVWTDWTEFTISQAAPSVTARPLGVVAGLAGKRLRADVRRPAEADSIVRYEVELAERASRDPSRWETPIWTDEGGPLVVRDRRRTPGRAEEMTIEALEGREPRQGMVVERRRPVVRIRTTRPMAAYSWKLVQHGDLIKATDETTANISSDGMCATFRLPNVARRGPGYFAPPFDRSLGVYRGETYGPNQVPSNPLGHSAYAVDHNRGSAGDDEGDPVLAAAKGRVVELDPGKGKVVLSHYGGAFRTEYGHLRVPFEVELHQDVDPLQRIGRISNTGVTAFHLHHAHYVKLTRGPFKGKFKPSRMRHGGRAVKVSQAGPDRFSPPWFEWRSDFTGFEPRGFRGWTSFDPKATLRVRVRFTDGSRSKTVELGFFVERRAIGEGAIDAGCRGSGLADDRLMIAHRYDGPTLEPGEYSVRYRCVDDKGSTSPWAFDHSLVVAG